MAYSSSTGRTPRSIPRSKENAASRCRRLLAPLALSTAVAAAAGLSASGAAGADDDGRDLLRSGLVGSTTTADGGPSLFGVAPGGAPWVVDHDSSVRVRDDGRVEVKIRGLVIPGRGNPVARVVATVVCNGAATVSTRPSDLSPAGDGRIRADVDLPEPCLAPAVLVRVATATGAPGAYIAANGGEGRGGVAGRAGRRSARRP